MPQEDVQQHHRRPTPTLAPPATRLTSSIPRPGEVYGMSPNSKAEDIDAACQASGTAFERWRWTTRRGAARPAQAGGRHRGERRRAGGASSARTRQAHGVTMSDEIPPMVDQIRFFAGAAPVLEGKASGEYMKGFTSSIRREPRGPVAQVAPWNYPMMMAVWIRPGPGRAHGCSSRRTRRRPRRSGSWRRSGSSRRGWPIWSAVIETPAPR